MKPAAPAPPPSPPRLHVCVDAVAALRESRHAAEPDPAAAGVVAEVAGADGVAARLREDRRPVTERDVRALRAAARRFTLEIPVDPTVLEIALDVAPAAVCLVPGRADEVPLERGLDCVLDPERIARVVRELTAAEAAVSVLIDPDARQIRAALAIGARAVTLHTGRFAQAKDAAGRASAFADLRMAAAAARELGLRIHAAHGLDLRTAAAVASLPGVEGVFLGHAVFARAVVVGIDRAVREARHALAAAAAAAHGGTPPFPEEDL